MSYIGNPVQSLNFVTDTFVGNGSTQSFELSQVPASAASIIVTVNGVKKIAVGVGVEYSVSGSTLTFTSAPANASNIEVIHLGIRSLVNVPGSSTITASMLAAELRNIIADQFTANGSTTSFTLTAAPLSANAVIVTANGVVQYDYSVSNTSLIFNFTPASGTIIRAAGYGNILTSGTITDDSVTTAKIQNNAVTSAKMSVTGVSASTYGGASAIPVVTLDAAGRATYAANVSIDLGVNALLFTGS